ncbi:MAG: hypothetical protein QJ16_C0013G0008 [archaeon GW2011_AR1]|nr:MAG: hypothetical protein QJ16_C0013G0008 [archaeon GW2011_AR1]
MNSSVGKLPGLFLVLSRIVSLRGPLSYELHEVHPVVFVELLTVNVI